MVRTHSIVKDCKVKRNLVELTSGEAEESHSPKSFILRAPEKGSNIKKYTHTQHEESRRRYSVAISERSQVLKQITEQIPTYPMLFDLFVQLSDYKLAVIITRMI